MVSLGRVVSGVLSFVLLSLPVRSGAAEFVELEVQETAGIRRFSYPVTGTVILPRVLKPDDVVQLSHDGTAVPVQVSPAENSETSVTLDFLAHLNPQERRRYRLSFGADVVPGPSDGRLIRTVRSDQKIVIDAGGAISYEIPLNLKGLLSSVRSKDTEWLRPTSPGITFSTQGQAAPIVLGSPDFPVNELKVTREGSHACQLRFESHGVLDEVLQTRCRGTITVPISKSWIELDLTVEDPDDVIRDCSVSLDFSVTPNPLLVDFASGEYTYLTLRGDEISDLTAFPGLDSSGVTTGGAQWSIRRGLPNKLEPFAERVSKTNDLHGGWLHIMDTQVCTAAGVLDFGHQEHDRWTVSAAGRVTLQRQFSLPEDPPAAATPTEKHLHARYHFVYFPPHISAITSPRSMLEPPLLRQLR